jgi:hypothetical protein
MNPEEMVKLRQRFDEEEAKRPNGVYTVQDTEEDIMPHFVFK